MSSYIVNKIITKYNIENFDTYFIFGENNNISLIKKFHRFVFEKMNFNDENKELYLNIFNKIQICRYGFYKLSMLWKVRKAKISSTDYDFFLNPLSNFPISQKVKIYHKGAIYNFRISDIINIWVNALSKNSSLIPIPEIPKNPYTNIEFNRGHLLKFYIHIRYHTKFIVPKLIQEYINSEMDIIAFKNNSYPDLIDIGIKNHIKNEIDELLYYDCARMISNYRFRLQNRSLSMNVSLNEKIKTVNILKPILIRYLYTTYSCNPKVRSKNKVNIVKDLKKVFKENPRLGRVIFRINRSDIPNDMSNNVIVDNSDNNIVIDHAERYENNDPDYSDSLPSLSEVSSDTDEEIFENELINYATPFFYQRTIGNNDFYSDDDENDPVNQVD